MTEAYTDLLHTVDRYYSEKLTTYGPTPRGVDWNSLESQQLRFAQLLKVCDFSKPASINDYGCGYGATASYLIELRHDFSYCGYDISEAMIEKARQVHQNHSNCTFSSQLTDCPKADYTIASGIFNVKFDKVSAVWQEYILTTLDNIAALSTKGFSFNMLTLYSDADRMRPDLYYADPHFFFDYCRTRFSKRVALLHDYPLYEFTILVRLD